MQEVGPGVVAAECVPTDAVDGGQGVLAGEQLAGDLGPVRGEAGQGRHGVVDQGRARLGHDGAGVAHLATALGVERGAVEEDLGLAGVLGILVGQDGHHPGRRRVAVRALTHEDRPALGVEHRAVGLLAGHRLAGFGRGAGLDPLAVHGLLEGLEVDGHSGLLGDLDGELDREPVGVVEPEGQIAGNHGGARGQLLFEDGRPGGQRAEESVLLPGHHIGDQAVLLGHGRVGRTRGCPPRCPPAGV